MTRFGVYFRSTVGRKAVAAVTGVIMVLFIIQHALGNLLIYQSAANLNRYAAFLKDKPGIVWPVRIILLTAVALHVWAVMSLAAQNRAARPVGYAKRTPQASTLASRNILVTGLLLLAFIVFHILHFTTGTILPSTHMPMDVYGNVVRGFRIWWVALFYFVAMVGLGMHLYHGLWGSPRTLGVENPYAPAHKPIPQIIAIVVWALFTSIPVAVVIGYLHL